VNHKGTVYPGEHERIVEQELWERVNRQLSLRSVHQRGRTHHRQEAPLRGLLYCAACGSAMSPSYTTKRGRRYRYYSCQTSTAKEGKDCSQRPVAAIDVEESILKSLEPVLGAGLDWNTIRDTVHDIQYERQSHRVVIGLKEGTRFPSSSSMSCCSTAGLPLAADLSLADRHPAPLPEWCSCDGYA
jgi:hypothetical protein